MRLTRKYFILACLPLLFSTMAEAGALLYIYQLPNGTRMVTNYQLNNKNYKLVRIGHNFNGMGLISAGSNPQFFRPSTSAYDDLIRRAALEHGMDFALVKAIMHVESAFNPYARSDKGAYGLMQVLPETAQRYGVDRNELYEPRKNIEAGVRYLKFLTTRFRDVRHVIAAYNAGENAVSTYGGIPPYAETASYVAKVLKQQRYYAAQS